jgi:putative heme-binding domain-containing protein
MSRTWSLKFGASLVLGAWCLVLSLPFSLHAQSPRKPLTQEDYRRFALLREGDAARGARLFSDTTKLLCSNCHSVDGKASKAGPDLYAVGDKFGRREIIDSILTPSATIAEGYAATIVETKTGEEYVGVIKQVTEDAIQLMGADGRSVTIPTINIARRRPSDVSLMPEKLEAALTLEEFNDLIEYLVTLKQPESSASLHRGMPSEIRLLTPPVTLTPFHGEALKFAHPVWFGAMPGQSNAYLVVEHETGDIVRLDKSSAGDTKSVFVNLEQFIKGTRGLLGMAFHPRFAENRRYYYAKHFLVDGHFSTHIFEREAAPDFKGDSGKPPRLILKMDNATGVHYGGGLQFGPDGYFYIGMGDTGPQEDPQGHGQNRQLLLGKMLRIDVDHPDAGRNYSIPADNPFVDRKDTRPEIWALGFREPWRFSFDSVTKDLWVGDVGQDRYEEVDLVVKGGNYGWNIFEGFEPFSNHYRRDGEQYLPPVFAYGRKYGVSSTGGFVYRANPSSSFYGVYICADFQSARIFGLTQEHGVLKTIRQIATAPERVVSFGLGHHGELFVVGYEGTIFQMDFESSTFE